MIGVGLGVSLFAFVPMGAAAPLACVPFNPNNNTADMCDWEVEGSPYTLKYYTSDRLRGTLVLDEITRAIIVVHGRRTPLATMDIRPFDYYEAIRNAAEDRRIEDSTLIIAPYFANNKWEDTNENIVDNPLCGGRASSDGRLCWGGGSSDYTAGHNAANDSGNVNSSSYAIVNDMIDYLAGQASIGGRFPHLNTIIITGQSAGGQFTQRYAMAGTAEPTNITIRYVACNPESAAYLNGSRPTQLAMDSFPNLLSRATCDHDNDNTTPDVLCISDPPPGARGPLADLETWSTLDYAFRIPYDYTWDGSTCYADGSYDRWPNGLGDVAVNDYMRRQVRSGNEARSRYLRRNVVLLNAIDDNHYVDQNYPCDNVECAVAVKGHSRAERNALFFNHVCDTYDCSRYGFATVYVDANGNGIMDPNERIGHGRVIYQSDATRSVLFDGAKPPSISYQKPLKGMAGVWMTISLSDLAHEYPAGSEFLVEPGENYTVLSSQDPTTKYLKPDAGYRGRLYVPVRVRSSIPNAPSTRTFISNRYFLKIGVETQIEWLFPTILSAPLK